MYKKKDPQTHKVYTHGNEMKWMNESIKKDREINGVLNLPI